MPTGHNPNATKGLMSLKTALSGAVDFTPPEDWQTPLEYILQIMNDPRQDPERRDRCAMAALPYVHPRNMIYKGKKAQDAENAKYVNDDWSGLLSEKDDQEEIIN